MKGAVDTLKEPVSYSVGNRHVNGTNNHVGYAPPPEADDMP